MKGSTFIVLALLGCQVGKPVGSLTVLLQYMYCNCTLGERVLLQLPKEVNKDQLTFDLLQVTCSAVIIGIVAVSLNPPSATAEQPQSSTWQASGIARAALTGTVPASASILHDAVQQALYVRMLCACRSTQCSCSCLTLS
jgi:hypothetical protein